MSMLAEPRRKKKWSVDPQGKRWSQNNEKIGQKLLEKMGWTNGKGLGVNEQGIVEHVRVHKRNPEHEKAGIGYDNDSHMKDLHEHQDKFNEFLQQLSKHHNQEETVEKLESNLNDLSGQSLELKSKQSRARLHYQKFTRGKDVSKYNSRDLANIFGKKELITKTEVNVQEDNSIYENEVIGTKNNWNGVVTINRGSISDYFKQKLPNHKKSLPNNSIDNEVVDSESEVEQYVGFGFKTENTYSNINEIPKSSDEKSNYAFDNPCLGMSSSTEITFNAENLKTENTYSTNEIPKNSDEKSNYAFDNPCLGMNSPTETTLNAENSLKKSKKNRKKESVPTETTLNTENSSKKSKKNRRKEFVPESTDLYIEKTNEVNIGKISKTGIIDSNCKNGFTNSALNLDTKPNEICNSKEFEVSRAQFGLENCGLDLTDEENNKKRVTFNDHVEYSTDTIKRKKGKATLDKFEVENKKHKKKRKRETTTTLSNGFVNEALDIEILSPEINDNELNEYKSTKIKKRKICKTSSLETIQESPEREKEIIEINLEDVILDTTENEETTVVKKSRKKKKKKEEVKIMDSNIVDVENEKDIIEKVIRNKKHKVDKNKEIHSKEKKKDKEECVTVSNEILEMEPQNTNHLVKIKNKKSRKQEIIIKESAKVETSPIVITIREGTELLREDVRKKKNKRNKDNCLEDEITCDVEKEVSDKENAIEEQESNIKLPKKNKKRKQSKNLDSESSTNPDADMIDVNMSSQENADNVEFTNTPSKKSQIIYPTNDVTHSPWHKKERMTKKILKRLFYGNLIADFPGSNIQDIKGYGIDVDGN